MTDWVLPLIGSLGTSVGIFFLRHAERTKSNHDFLYGALILMMGLVGNIMFMQEISPKIISFNSSPIILLFALGAFTFIYGSGWLGNRLERFIFREKKLVQAHG